MLVCLTNKTSSKVKFQWTKIEQDAFDDIKRIMAHNTLSAYPDFNEELNIRSNAINLQLGAVIIQKVKLISFYSIKLTDSQKSYTVTENEMLSIIETLKEFITILLGKIFRIYTDHKKLTCNF